MMKKTLRIFIIGLICFSMSITNFSMSSVACSQNPDNCDMPDDVCHMCYTDEGPLSCHLGSPYYDTESEWNDDRDLGCIGWASTLCVKCDLCHNYIAVGPTTYPPHAYVKYYEIPGDESTTYYVCDNCGDVALVSLD